MNQRDFDAEVERILGRCREVLTKKGDEYTPVRSKDEFDRFAQFKKAAALQGITPIQALGGMMSKHTTSVYDMITEDSKNYEKWEEKIGDHINYLVLLLAMLTEEMHEELDEEDIPFETPYGTIQTPSIRPSTFPYAGPPSDVRPSAFPYAGPPSDVPL